MSRIRGRQLVWALLVLFAAAMFVVLVRPDDRPAPSAASTGSTTAAAAVSPAPSGAGQQSISPTSAASPQLPTPVPTPLSTPSTELTIELPVEWRTLSLPTLPAPWTYGKSVDMTSDGGGYIEILRDGKYAGAIELWVFQTVGWGTDVGAGRDLLRTLVTADSQSWADTNVEQPAVTEVPFGGPDGGTAVRFGFQSVDAAGQPTTIFVEQWYFDGQAVWRFTTGWPPDPEFGGVTFHTAADMQAFLPVLDSFGAQVGLPHDLPTPAPIYP